MFISRECLPMGRLMMSDTVMYCVIPFSLASLSSFPSLFSLFISLVEVAEDGELEYDGVELGEVRPAEGMDSARDLAEERSAAAAVDGLRHLTQVKGVE